MIAQVKFLEQTRKEKMIASKHAPPCVRTQERTTKQKKIIRTVAESYLFLIRWKNIFFKMTTSIGMPILFLNEFKKIPNAVNRILGLPTVSYTDSDVYSLNKAVEYVFGYNAFQVIHTVIQDEDCPVLERLTATLKPVTVHGTANSCPGHRWALSRTTT